MATLDNILHDAKPQITHLAELLLAKFKNQAVADAQDFLQSTRDDLNRWTDALATGQLDKEGYESLVRGAASLAKMRALKQQGLAQITLDTFTNGIVEILLNATFAALKI